MAKSEEIAIVTPSPNRDFDNPFNDQTAFSPPQGDTLLGDGGGKRGGGGGGGGGGGKYTELLGSRERSVSQPPSFNLRESTNVTDPFPTPPTEGRNFRRLEDKVQSNPNLTTRFVSPFATTTGTPILFDRTQSTPLEEAFDVEGRAFHSAPVTPCQTPLGSRQGSPKAARKAGGLLGAIFGAGIYGRQLSDGGKPGLFGHLEEDNEDDMTPVGSPGIFTVDQLKTRLRYADDDANRQEDNPFQLPRGAVGGYGIGGGVLGGGVVLGSGALRGQNVDVIPGPEMSKKDEKKDYSYRELTFLTPSSM